jgi:predicted transcriptional regulator
MSKNGISVMKPNELTDDQLREIIFARHARLAMFHISAIQWQLLSTIRACGGMTTKRLAVILNVSIQSASLRLAKLHTLGYCDRDPAPDGTGGTVYNYRVRVGL